MINNQSSPPPTTRQTSHFAGLRDRIDDQQALPNKPTPADHDRAVNTGLRDLDELVTLLPGELIVVGARPGDGKSTLCMNIASHAAYRQNIPVAVMSMQTLRQQLVRKVLAAEAGVSHRLIERGNVDAGSWAKLAKATEVMDAGRLLVDERRGLSLAEVMAAGRIAHRDYGIGLFVVDCVQYVNGRLSADESRQQVIGNVTRGLKALAGELGIPVLAAAQLNRGADQRTDRRPQLSDFREAGDIEADADTAILIQIHGRSDADDPRAGEADLIVAKHRNGCTDTIAVAAQLHYSRFVDMAL